MMMLISVTAWLVAHRITVVAVLLALIAGAAIQTIATAGWRGFVATWLS
jgi:hypothetical protein